MLDVVVPGALTAFFLYLRGTNAHTQEQIESAPLLTSESLPGKIDNACRQKVHELID